MSTFSCKYHPDRVAVTKCEDCHSYICLACKNVYHHISRTKHRSYSTEYELCPICNAERVKGETNPVIFMIMAIMVIVFIIIGAAMFSRTKSSYNGMYYIHDTSPPDGFLAFFFLIPVIFLCIIGFQCLIRGPQQREEADRLKETQLSDSPPDIQLRVLSNKTEVSLNNPKKIQERVCNQCGQILEANTNFCSNCGNTTIDEFQK